MTLTDRLAALAEMYGLYDEVGRQYFGTLACGPSCATCCTQAVMLTGLEAIRLWRSEAFRKLQITDDLTPDMLPVTFNEVARLSLTEDAPPETRDDAAGLSPCLLVRDNLCPVYPDRPFHCRCMVSRVRCGGQGWAEMEDLWVSIHTLFLQAIEQLDTPGVSGYLGRMIAVLSRQNDLQAYPQALLTAMPPGLVCNQAVPAWMAPPEHHQPLRPLLTALTKILKHTHT